MVSLEQQRGVTALLGHRQEVLAEFPGLLVLARPLANRQSPDSTGKSWGVSPTCWHSTRARA
jgi:hypothetical protein